jgi:hypothetical protein
MFFRNGTGIAGIIPEYCLFALLVTLIAFLKMRNYLEPTNESVTGDG